MGLLLNVSMLCCYPERCVADACTVFCTVFFFTDKSLSVVGSLADDMPAMRDAIYVVTA